jgi:outer membrane biosynthesis protein TonB
LVRESDLVTNLFNRLGSIGVLLIAGALIIGGLAGAAVAHHYERLSTESAASQQQVGDQQGSTQDQQGDHSDRQGATTEQGEQGDKPDSKSTKKPTPKTTTPPKKAKATPSASPKPKPSGSPKPSSATS